MAINRLGGLEKWTELATSSPTSGSSVSFTSIPSGYWNLALVWDQVFVNSAGVASIRFNNDTGNTYSWVVNADNIVSTTLYTIKQIGRTTGISLGTILGTNSADSSSGKMLISGANDVMKDIQFWMASTASVTYGYNNGKANWKDQTAINQIDFILGSAATFSGGLIKLYGKN